MDLRLGEAHGWYASIDRFVQERLGEYEDVYGKGYAHPDKSTIDIRRFCGVEPFDLERFDTAPRHITFVLRDDRLWYRSRMMRFADRVSVVWACTPSSERSSSRTRNVSRAPPCAASAGAIRMPRPLSWALGMPVPNATG